MPKSFVLLGSACALLCSSVVVAHAPVLDFNELEGSYSRSGGTTEAQEHLVAAIPSGMEVGKAQAILIEAGATCRSPSHLPSVRQCLIHQYSLADGAADDIRWTVSLEAPGDHVQAVSVKRYVDRHGSN